MDSSLLLLVGGIVLVGVSGMPGLLSRRDYHWGQRLATCLTLAGALAGLAGAGLVLGGAAPADWRGLGADALSAWFLVPIFLIGGLGALYGEGYWRQKSHPVNGRKLRLFWGWLLLGMGVLVIARHGIVFLMGWEVMALSAFFLVSTEDEVATVRASGWVYLIATHLGTLCLFAMFALLRAGNGSFALRPLDAAGTGLGMLTAIYLLALVGFGLKAGILPLHFWLPGAHANAPSHVSALMSGVLIKMGIYGLVRFLGLLPDPPVAWGGILLILGAISGVGGVLLAIGQHDLKRLLAYHSVENIGIIVMGLGLAMLGRSAGRPDWVVLGLAGCLLHVWNHSLFKSLLFLGAGSVVHATGTRENDHLGGLGRNMPRTAGFFLVGAAAICGLPPLNGFVSELLVYLGLFRTAGVGEGVSWPAAAMAAPALAMIGALAVACFVKVSGAVFLGSERTAASGRAVEARASMLV
ncbi:MAG: proton-conducting transporter membrane subunit, partial [Lentisphaeria bacterium]|nr:proton-conducting transporter membrane subunit [Lentisphaeria bacterium]